MQVHSKRSTRLRRAIVAIIASGVVAAPAAHAKSVDSRIVVPPADLPEVARHAGEAMLLRQTLDGRTLLYIEQNQGARLAVLDVTDPGFVRAERSVQLATSGAFDFISTLGNWAELVRFRQGPVDAVFDMHNADAPTITEAQSPTILSSPSDLAHDEDMPLTDDPIVDRANSLELNGGVDANPAPVEVTNRITGTTFLLTQDGLYLIRHREAEMIEKWREQAYSN
jgi:hypothetical protein